MPLHHRELSSFSLRQLHAGTGSRTRMRLPSRDFKLCPALRAWGIKAHHARNYMNLASI
jgi:hypothetical protein